MSHAPYPQHLRLAAALRVFGAVGLTLMLLLGTGFSARAGPVCLTHGDLIDRLRAQYAEERVALAVTATGSLVEVFASPDGATWTLVVTMVDGRSCILIAGEDWIDSRRVAAEGPGA